MPAPETILQGRYRIIRELGRGGMGAVYEALDMRLGRVVALKETLAQENHLRRAFEHEARLLANLRHPALPKVIDHFSEGPGMFLVMEFIPGLDLEQLLYQRGYPFPASRVLEWTKNLLNALDFLHRHNPPIVHRDIKPSNLKITENEEIILLDFGLAKGAAGHMTRQIAPSVLGYTQHYASLEQMQGERTSPQSDLYSLAATMYHLLTGRTPIDALKRATEVMSGYVDPLKPVNELNRHIPPGFAQVLMKALSMNPAQRPESAAAMRSELSTPAGVHNHPVLPAFESQKTLPAPPPQPFALVQGNESFTDDIPPRRVSWWILAPLALLVGAMLVGIISMVVNTINGSKDSSGVSTNSNAVQNKTASISRPPAKLPRPTPSPSMVPQGKYTSSDVLAAFRGKGLEVDRPTSLRPNATSRSEAMRRMTEGVRFYLPSACPNCDVWVYSFPTDSDTHQADLYFKELGESGSFSWVFRKENLLIQLSGEVPVEKANHYGDALQTLEKSSR